MEDMVLVIDELNDSEIEMLNNVEVEIEEKQSSRKEKANLVIRELTSSEQSMIDDFLRARNAQATAA